MHKFDKHILAVKADAIQKILQDSLANNGFSKLTYPEQYKDLVSIAVAARRGDLEIDPTYKQIIPYLVLFDDKDHILYYIRNSKNSETRLDGKLSIGIGGHVEGIDAHGTEDWIKHALLRELNEEFGDNIAIENLTPKGFIYREDTDVDTVHIGILFTAQISQGVIKPEAEEIAEVHFVSQTALYRLLETHPGLETWTKIAVKYLFKP